MEVGAVVLVHTTGRLHLSLKLASISGVRTTEGDGLTVSKRLPSDGGSVERR